MCYDYDPAELRDLVDEDETQAPEEAPVPVPPIGSVFYVVEHRIADAPGPEGEWHQEFAFAWPDVRDEFLAWLSGPETASLRPDGWEYRTAVLPVTETEPDVIRRGLEVMGGASLYTEETGVAARFSQS